jgi:uncharacterized membrane protein HdeD (DUF308 family)
MSMLSADTPTTYDDCIQDAVELRPCQNKGGQAVSPSQSSANSNVSAALTKSMHDHWGLYLGEGIVLILLGLAAIVFSFIAGIVATVFLGWLFLIAGIVGLVSTLRGRQAPGFGWSLLSALVALVAGTVLLWNPLQSLVSLVVWSSLHMC